MPATPTDEVLQRGGARGQSLVEFALILPLMLAFVGVTLDVARAFQAWIVLESATRDAAELVATSSASVEEATAEARRVVCVQAQALPGFQPGTGSGTEAISACRSPNVSVLSFSLSPIAAGGSSRNPVGSATVRASLPFRPALAWPLITSEGAWTLGSTRSFSVIQGR